MVIWNNKKTIYLLTGDIGGTNSRMSLYKAGDENCSTDKPLVVKYFRNAEYLPKEQRHDPNCFQTNIIIPFIKYCWEEQKDCTSLVPFNESNVEILATLAVAGVVSNNKVNITNLDNLLVDGTSITNNKHDIYLKHIKICRIINDFVAQGYGCLTLKKDEVRYLYGPPGVDVEKLPVGPKVCIGAGTGLGECYLTPNDSDDGTYTCYPSEGGHVEYAPRNHIEVEMFEYMKEKFTSHDRISVERVVSGTGLANVYDFLVHKFPTHVVKEVHDEYEKVQYDDKGRIVAINVDKAPLCKQAMDIMMNAYGCEVGSAAIKFIPTGGLYVTGGLTPKNIQYIDGLHTQFMLSYRNKGRVSTILERVPLYAVMTEDLGVRGVHKAAIMEYNKYINAGGELTMVTKFKNYMKENGLILTTTASIGFIIGTIITNNKRK